MKPSVFPAIDTPTSGTVERDPLESGFVIRPLSSRQDFVACVAVQHAIWGADFTEIIPISVLKVAQQVGGIAVGAFTASNVLAGFVFGLSGIRDHRFAHWSDTLAVLESFRDHGIGTRLKRYQRKMLIEYGVTRIHWTFDPLESRNAYVNFARLGITASEYHRDFYGDTESRLHDGIGTDRLIAQWDIQDERVVGRLAGAKKSPTATEISDVPLINPWVASPTGPLAGEPRLALTARCLRLAIPADIQALKEATPKAAADWRTVTRAAFEEYLGRGYVVTEVARDSLCSNYLLELA
ncbi:MAG: hypothetical protein ABI026_06040 [Gemmatimonadaceae bacterium]